MYGLNWTREQWERNEVETTFVDARHIKHKWIENEKQNKRKRRKKKKFRRNENNIKGWNFQGDDCAWYFFTSFFPLSYSTSNFNSLTVYLFSNHFEEKNKSVDMLVYQKRNERQRRNDRNIHSHTISEVQKKKTEKARKTNSYVQVGNLNSKQCAAKEYVTKWCIKSNVNSKLKNDQLRQSTPNCFNE